MGKWHNKTARDDEYIKAYLETHSQLKAAKMCGVGRETIARAVRRANIPLTGRKHNDGSLNGQLKITDEQIRQEAKSNSAYDIARKYNISPERLSRRAKRIGIDLNWKGGAPHRWKQRAAFYNVTEFDETITLKALRARDKDICQICGEPVNDKDIKDGHIRKRYPTLDHIIPLSKGGSHTWDNIQLAHMGCNAGKCDRTGK